VKGHLNTKVRPQALTCREMALIGKVGREELTFIADQGLAQKLEFVCRETRENPLTEGPPFVTACRATCGLRHHNLEVDIFGKPLVLFRPPPSVLNSPEFDTRQVKTYNFN
jgi:hypothetical protein